MQQVAILQKKKKIIHNDLLSLLDKTLPQHLLPNSLLAHGQTLQSPLLPIPSPLRPMAGTSSLRATERT